MLAVVGVRADYLPAHVADGGGVKTPARAAPDLNHEQRDRDRSQHDGDTRQPPEDDADDERSHEHDAHEHEALHTPIVRPAYTGVSLSLDGEVR